MATSRRLAACLAAIAGLAVAVAPASANDLPRFTERLGDC